MAYTTLKKALIGALALSAASAAFAADKPKTMTGASATMLSNTCAGCHGTYGASTGPATPSIGGMDSEYFVDVMTRFANDEMNSTIMGRIAKGYSEEEIAAMADYFMNQKYVIAKQSYDADSAKKGAKLHDKYCEKCHSEGGVLAEDGSGFLGGQHVTYLKYALTDFTAGDREMPKKMKKQYDKMMKKEGDGGIEALMNYYASFK